MNRAETEDGSYASARNRKLLTEWAAKAGESEYAEPALNPCQTTAFEFFTDDELAQSGARSGPFRSFLPGIQPGSETGDRGPANRNPPEGARVVLLTCQEDKMGKSLLLWLIGVPLPIVLLLYFFVFR
jgi:hypothetical protein